MRTRHSVAAAMAAIVFTGTALAGTEPAGTAASGVPVEAAGRLPDGGTVAVDETFDMTCRRPSGEPAGSVVVRITATVPAELATGATFSVPDLAYTASTAGQPLIRPEGTDQSFLTPTTVMTVVAPAGETVTLRLESFVIILAGRPVATCFPEGHGVLAQIPVVA